VDVGKLRVSHGRFGGTLGKLVYHIDVLAEPYTWTFWGDLRKIRTSHGRFVGPLENYAVTCIFSVDLAKITVSHENPGLP
jgi:hypothetical protein